MFNVEPITERFILATGIIVLLVIALFSILILVFERKDYYDEAVADVAQAWSDHQSFAGPLLLVTERESEAGESDSRRETKTIVVMPSELSLTHVSSHEVRNRGIYRIPVFSASVSVTASFPPFDESLLKNVQSAGIAIGVTDSRGLRSATIRWNDKELGEQTSAQMQGIGSIVKTSLNRNDLVQGGTVAVDVELRGTERFSVLPIGDKTTVSMSSDWPHPSFDGRYLPDTREITESGFSASWTTHSLSRGFPSQLSTTDLGIALRSIVNVSNRQADLGYSVVMLNSPYRAVERSIKYGVLFVVMTMIGLICIELVFKTRLHIVQYGVVGAGLVLFFLILLALSEHIGYAASYTVAAMILALMISTYVWFACRNRSVVIAMLSMLLVLYVALYVLLQLNDYALLVGSALLLILLAALMYATRTLRAGSFTEPDSN